MKFYNVAKVMETCPFLNLNEPGHFGSFECPLVLLFDWPQVASFDWTSCVAFEWAFYMLLRMYLLCTLQLALVLITEASSFEPLFS